MRQRWNELKARLAPSDPDRIDLFLSAPFLAVHLSLAAVPWLGFGPREAAMAGATYAAGMFFVTAGYHRYFAHRAFRAGRAVQLLLAVGAQCTVQRGVLWWAGHHRAHHRFSDGPRDPHASSRGLAWSHLGWFLSSRNEEAPLARVRDLARFPELRWLERWYWVPPLALGLAVAAAGGLRLVVGGYLLGVVALWHATFTINSLAHRWGTRPYPTRDGSRNNALLALLTFGEGWHNNHHHAPGAARQGFRWWQLDLTWLALSVLERLGVVRELRPGPRDVRPRPARAAAPPAHATAAALAALVLAFPRPAHGEGEGPERFVGTARGRDGAVLYREAHEVLRAGDRLVSALTVYTDAAGRRIGVLHTDFAADPFAPAYVFEDLRSGAAESVARSPDGLVVRAGGRSRTLAPREGRPVAAGQGLDRLVRARLGELALGESLALAYVIPSRLDAYDLRVRAVEAGGSADRVRVRVEFSSWLLRLLAPALEVEYDRPTRRLLRYRGPSNLADARGENPEVEITYAYDEAGVAAGELHGAL